MMPLPRSPTRLGVRPALGAMLLMTACAAGAQQWTRGEQVWTNTGCAGCHTGNLSLASMQARLQTVVQARTAADSASARTASMNVLWSTLNDGQKNDVSAYVAGYRAEGNVSASPGAALTVPAVGQSASADVTLFNNGRAPMVVATNNGVRLSGSGAPHFSFTGLGNGCQAQTLAPNGGSCQVRVTYRPTAAPNPTHVATLTFEHNGEPLATTSLPITGTLSAAPPPSPAASGGGGALSALWLALLPAALRRRRTA